MNGEAELPLVGLIMMLVIWFWFFRWLGLFRGFWTGFWAGFWTRIFVGTLRSPTGSGLLEKVVKTIVMAMIILFLLACIGSMSGQ